MRELAEPGSGGEGWGGGRRRGVEATKTRFWMKQAPCCVREFHMGWSGWTVPPTMGVERVCVARIASANVTITLAITTILCTIFLPLLVITVIV